MSKTDTIQEVIDRQEAQVRKYSYDKLRAQFGSVESLFKLTKPLSEMTDEELDWLADYVVKAVDEATQAYITEVGYSLNPHGPETRSERGKREMMYSARLRRRFTKLAIKRERASR